MPSDALLLSPTGVVATIVAVLATAACVHRIAPAARRHNVRLFVLLGIFLCTRVAAWLLGRGAMTDTQAVADVWGYKWSKLAYGSLLFATALANESMSETLADPQHQTLLAALAREVTTIALGAGVTPVGFDGFDPAAFSGQAGAPQAAVALANMADHYRRSSKQRSGVWRDLAVRKRKTEVDTQIAEIVRVAQAQGLQAPVTRILIRLIQEVEQGTRMIDRANLLAFADEVAALAPRT